ncbi:hypothetical protein B0H21DRAFT_702509, partial [Amylocystis lapponica]
MAHPRRLTVDPNTLERPDYTLPAFAEPRQQIIDINGSTEEQAITLLNAVWMASNNRDRISWQGQLDTDAAEAAQRAQDLAAAEEQRLQDEVQEAAQAKKDEVRKNRDKYLPIPMRPTPRADLVLAAPYALRRLEKALYLELYYYTNVGLDAASSAISGADDEVMSMRQNEDGSASWIPAATAKASKTAIDDKDLSWEQVMEAVPRFITAM